MSHNTAIESHPDQNQSPVKTKSKKMAGFLAIVLGIFGAHRFYMGQLKGLVYLLFSIIGLFPFVFVFSVYEGVKYLVLSEENWNKVLNPHLKSPEERKRENTSVMIKWILFVLLITAVTGYLGYRENKAKADADAFCANYQIGSPIEPVKEIAKTTGENMLRTIEENEVTVGFIGIPPFSRHLCIIESEAGKD